MTRKRIYVADDDPDILHILETILVWQGYEVITSSDGLSLKSLERPPDMVFLDIAMQVSNGGHICYQYKSNPNTSPVPVILVSADVRLEEIAEESGADAVLHKPFGILEVANLALRYAGVSEN